MALLPAAVVLPVVAPDRQVVAEHTTAVVQHRLAALRNFAVGMASAAPRMPVGTAGTFEGTWGLVASEDTWLGVFGLRPYQYTVLSHDSTEIQQCCQVYLVTDMIF